MLRLGVKSEQTKIGWCFPGQSPETIRADVSNIAAGCDEASFILEEASDIFHENMTRLCTSPAEEVEAELRCDTLKAQGAVITKNSIYIARAKQFGVCGRPIVVGGQSVALLSALEAAGVQRSAVFNVVRVRGGTMKNSPQGSMIALLDSKKLNIKGIETLCNRYGAVIGLYNSHQQVVVSGLDAAVRKVAEEALARGYASKSSLVNGRYAYHSSLMAEPAIAVEEHLENVNFPEKLNCPVMENLTAKKIRKGDEAKVALVADITGSNRWDRIIRKMDREVEELYEMGPGSVLTKMTNRTLRDEVSHQSSRLKSGGTIVTIASGAFMFGVAVGAVVYKRKKQTE